MAEERIDSYIDLTATGQETKQFVVQLNEIYDFYKKLDGFKLKLSADQSFGSAADTIAKIKKAEDDLLRVTKQLEEAQKGVNSQFSSQKTIFSSVGGSIDENIKKQIELQAKLKKTQADIKKLEDFGGGGGINLRDEIAALRKEEILLQAELKGTTAELKTNLQAQIASNGSIDEARAKLIALRRERNSQDLTSAGGQQRVEALNKEIDLLDEFINKNTDAYTQRKINIGNYSGAVKVLDKTLVEVKKKLDDLTNSGKQDTEVFQALKKEFDALNGVLNSQAGGFVSMREEIRENQVAIEQLSLIYGEDSEVVRQLILENGKLRDSFKDLQATQRAVGSDTFAFDALLQGGQALVGIYSAAQGAAALFGEDNEELQKTMVKLQASLALVQGVQATVNALQKESSLIQGVLAAKTFLTAQAQKLYAFATGGATVATNIFRTALLATGIGAILVLLSTAASAMNVFGDETEDATDDLDSFNESLENSKRILDSYSKSLDFQNTIALEKAKQRGASERELNDIAIQGLLQRKKINDEEIRNLTEKFNNLSGQEKNYTEISNAIFDARDERIEQSFELERQIALKREEFSTKQIEDARKKAKEQAQINSENLERERKARFEIEKLNQEDKINDFKAIADSEGRSLRERTQARLDQFEAQRTLAIAQMDFELQNTKLTTSERKLIELKTSRELIALEQQTANDIIAIRKSIQDAENAEIDTTLSTLKAGAEKDEERRFDKTIQRLQIQADTENALNLENYKNGLIGKEQYEAEKLSIENRFRRDSLLAEIEHQERIINSSFTNADEREAAEKALFNLKRQLNAEDLADTEKTAEKKIEIEKRKNDKLKELGNELKELAFTFLTAGIEREKNEIQASIDALEEKKQKDIEVANQTIQNSAQRADAIAVIEARANAQREALERRKRQLDLERARYERVKNIADIIQSTAIAVVSALGSKPFTPANIALAAIVGAIGAAQIARVLATPLPRFFKGKKKEDPYEGFGIVGDGGKSELHIKKDGSMEVTPNKPTLTYVQRGDVILPDANVLMAMAKNSTDRTINRAANLTTPNPNENLTKEIKGMRKDVVQAIRNIPQTVVKTDPILKKWIRSQGSINEFL